MTVRTFTIGLGAAALLILTGTRDGRANENVDEKFTMMDANGDGKISEEEWVAGNKAKFEMIDTNTDGKLTVTEMETAHAKMGKGGKMKVSVSEKFKVMDTNKDGSVSEEEYTDGSKTMFEKIDTDKDGNITKVELKAGHDKMMSIGKVKPMK